MKKSWLLLILPIFFGPRLLSAANLETTYLKESDTKTAPDLSHKCPLIELLKAKLCSPKSVLTNPENFLSLEASAIFDSFFFHRRYFCHCSEVSIHLRASGMTKLIFGIEKKIKLENKPVTIAFTFVASGAAITELILIDTLLHRNKKVKLAIDFIDPIYSSRSGENELIKSIFSSLSKKYPERIISYQLRINNFSDIDDLSPLFGKESSFSNPDFNIAWQQNEKIFVLAAFDPGYSCGFFAYDNLRKLLRQYVAQVNKSPLFKTHNLFDGHIIESYTGENTVEQISHF